MGLICNPSCHGFTRTILKVCGSSTSRMARDNSATVACIELKMSDWRKMLQLGEARDRLASTHLQSICQGLHLEAFRYAPFIVTSIVLCHIKRYPIRSSVPHTLRLLGSPGGTFHTSPNPLLLPHQSRNLSHAHPTSYLRLESSTPNHLR